MNTHAYACTYHVCSRSAGIAARAGGAYRAPSLDTEGFLHCSQAHQVRGELERCYASQTDLGLLVVDPTRLTSVLKYAAPASLPGTGAAAPVPNERFPHLYGPVESGAILDIVDVTRFNGKPVHPDTAALLRHYRFARLPVESTL